MMQGLAMFGLIIVAIVIYCACTLLIATMINAIEGGDCENFVFFAWLAGGVLFVAVVMLWGMGEPFPVSMG